MQTSNAIINQRSNNSLNRSGYSAAPFPQGESLVQLFATRLIRALGVRNALYFSILSVNYSSDRRCCMHNEFTMVIEQDGEWFIGYCPEIPGANGQGRTVEECREDLAEAIALILEDRREDGLRGVPPDAIRDVVVVQ